MFTGYHAGMTPERACEALPSAESDGERGLRHLRIRRLQEFAGYFQAQPQQSLADRLPGECAPYPVKMKRRDRSRPCELFQGGRICETCRQQPGGLLQPASPADELLFVHAMPPS